MSIRDNEVIGQVRQALAHDPQLKAPRITITMLGDSLALSGVLDTPEEVMRAEHVARQAAPGVAIDNSLTVGMSQHGGDTVNLPHEKSRPGWKDAELQADASKRLMTAYDALTNRIGNVGVEVVNGLAHLQGAVSTVKDRMALIEAVGRTPGLKRVIADGLEVAPFGTADDIRLGNLAAEKLQHLAPDLSAQVSVDVRNRSAFMIGSVRTFEDRVRAEDVLAVVPGIKHIHNELKLYQDESSEDFNVQVEQQVRHAFGAAGLPVPNIQVYYAAGVLGLDGEVENFQQRQQAVLVANEVLHRVVGEVYQISDHLLIDSRRGSEPTPESKLVQERRGKVTNEPVIPLEQERGAAPQNKARHTAPIEDRPINYE